jgi:hypothetical protein
MKIHHAVSLLLLAGCASQSGINLRDMGSFHVGGRSPVAQSR